MAYACKDYFIVEPSAETLANGFSIAIADEDQVVLILRTTDDAVMAWMPIKLVDLIGMVNSTIDKMEERQ